MRSVTPRAFVANPLQRSRAASSAHSAAVRRRVLNHAAARRRRQELLGKSHHAHQPIEHMGLQFRAGGTRRPQHALDAQPRRQQVTENRGPRVIGRKEREEVR